MAYLWADFVNSDERDYRGRDPSRDRLDDPRWLDGFLKKWCLRAPGARHPEARQALRRLRDLLQRMIIPLSEGRPPSDQDLAALNRYLAARPVRPHVERHEGAYRVRLESAATGLDAALFAIAVSFAELLEKGDPSRLKLCGNPDCRWVFYDTTRSRTRRWCAHNCGNLMKVREFRKRRGSDAPG